jgi:hypothetical protein
LDDCHQTFLQNGNTARFSFYTESRNISLESVNDFFITLERSETRQDKFESILEIIESVVSSPFVKAEADSVE